MDEDIPPDDGLGPIRSGGQGGQGGQGRQGGQHGQHGHGSPADQGGGGSPLGGHDLFIRELGATVIEEISHD
jgi:hypothetical protein